MPRVRGNVAAVPVATPVLCPDRSDDNKTNRTDRTNRKARSENLFPIRPSRSIRPVSQDTPTRQLIAFLRCAKKKVYVFLQAHFFSLIFYEIMIL